MPVMGEVKMERDMYIYIYTRQESLTGFIPGISRGNGGLILCRKFLTSRTSGVGEKRLKYYPRDGFPMPGLRHAVREQRNIEEATAPPDIGQFIRE